MTWLSRSLVGVSASCTLLIAATMSSVWLPIFVARSLTVMLPICVVGVTGEGQLVITVKLLVS